MLASAYGDDDESMEALNKMYELTLCFLNWENVGKVYAIGCPVREVLETT